MAKTKKRKAIRHARIKVGRNLEATWIGTNNMGPNTRSSLKLKLKLMTHEMRRTVRQIAICTDKRHMAGAAAHCHSASGHICFATTDYATIEFLAHEVAHALIHTLQRAGSSFLKEWGQIAGIEYGSPDFKDQHFPCDGLVCEYGSKNIDEDIATHVQYIYNFLHTYQPTPLFKITKNDPRYYAKLRLLLKYHFINQRHFDLIAPLFR